MNKQNYRIMAVDDNEVVREMLSDKLSTQGYTVNCASSGEEAALKAKSCPVDLFLIDLSLPKMNGLELLEKLDIKSNIYEAIIITGNTDLHSAKKSMQLGAFSYITKPIDYNDLDNQLRKALEMVELKQEKRNHYNNLEQSLIISEKQWRETFDVLDDLIFIVDENCKILKANKALRETFPAQQVESEFCYRLIHGTDSPPEHCVSCNALHTGVAVHTEMCLGQLNGRYFDLRAVPILDACGSATRAVHSMRDITERKKIEKEMEKHRNVLYHAGRVATIGELATSLAHELNQPLAAILSNAQAAIRFLHRKTPDFEEVLCALKDIVKDNQRAGNIISHLRSMLRKGEIKEELLDFNEVINEMLTLVRSDAIISNISIHSNMTPDLPLFRGDRIQFQQVILNIIMNCSEAMMSLAPTDRNLTICTYKEKNEYLILEIMDSGTGIKEEDMEKVFEPFYTTKQNGLGMGLAICKSIIQAHVGEISLRNNANRPGLTIQIKLPVIKDSKQ